MGFVRPYAISSPPPFSTGPRLLKDRSRWGSHESLLLLEDSEKSLHSPSAAHWKEMLAAIFQSDGWLGPMKVVRQGRHLHLCVWAHQYVQLMLLSSIGFPMQLWPRLYLMQSAPSLQKDVINEKDLSKERRHRNYLRPLKTFTWKTWEPCREPWRNLEGTFWEPWGNLEEPWEPWGNLGNLYLGTWEPLLGNVCLEPGNLGGIGFGAAPVCTETFTMAEDPKAFCCWGKKNIISDKISKYIK